MSICLSSSRTISKCLLPSSYQVAHYNDKYIHRKKQWPDIKNPKRKTKVLRKILGEIEASPHDEMLEVAVRYSEGEFRAQMLHLRESWDKTYLDRDETAKAVQAAQFEELEQKRWSFVERLEAEQKEKREKRKKISDQDSLPSLSIEEEYRRKRLISHEHELEEFIEQQKQGSLITPANIDEKLDSFLSDNLVSFKDNIILQKGPNTAPRTFYTFHRSHNIEFVLDGTGRGPKKSGPKKSGTKKSGTKKSGPKKSLHS